MGDAGMVNVNPSSIIANIVNFLILVFIVKHFFYDKINGFMQQRAEDIAAEIKDAEALKIAGEQFKEEYQEKITKIQDESRQIIKEASQKGEERRSEIIKAAQEEVDKIFERNATEIEREKEKVLEEVKNNIIDLSIYAAEKVVSESIDRSKHEKLILDFIEEVGEVK
ncbi:MAG: F0F1 ATP synthase subunit B [Eubacteriales bacterium]